MDLDGSLQIEWDEWRQFHLLNPHAHNIKDILKFWKHATVSVLSSCSESILEVVL